MKKIRKRIMSLILTSILICTTFTSTVLAAETAPLRLYMSSGEIAREQAYFDSLSRDELIRYLWESDEFVDDNTLTVNITRIRKKLEECGMEEVIKTKRGQGYILG